MIAKGSNSLKAYVGSTEVSKMYKGDVLVYSSEEPIVWDYEWYPPAEIPSWLHISANASHEMQDDCFRIHPATGTNAHYKIMMYFDPTEFPTTKSYEVRIDMYNTISRLAGSTQGGVGFTQSTSNGDTGLLYLKRRNDTKISGTSYYLSEVSTSVSRNSGNQITNDLRYIVTLTFDNENGLATLDVNGISKSRSIEGCAPRGMINRYANSGYIDIYSIKIRVL